MPTNLNQYIQQLSWEEAREIILKVNPEFVAEVDKITVPTSWQMFKVRYRYGDNLIENGQFMVRNAIGENVPLTDKSIPKDMQKKLTYAPCIPVGILLNKRAELFFKTSDQRVAPIMLMKPGYIFALTGVISKEQLIYDQGRFWNLTAGARSVYSIPKISLTPNHVRLSQKFNISERPPKNYYEQWQTFKEIMQSEQLKDSWEMEVLLFSKEWIEENLHEQKTSLGSYLHEYASERSTFLRNWYLSDFILSQVESEANVKQYPNNLNALRHALSIAGGFFPGLSFHCGNDTFPKDTLSIIYRDIYELDYNPCFLSLDYFNPERRQSVYSSLTLPMQIDFYHTKSPFKSKLDEVRDLSHSIRRVTKILEIDQFGIKDISRSPLRGTAQADINVYHTHCGRQSQRILPIQELSSIEGLGTKDNLTSSLYRGMIGIHPKKVKVQSQ